MDQRTIVACLALKGLSPRAIHKDLMDTPWPDAAAYSSVRHYFRDACCLPSVQRTRSVEVDRGINEANQAWHDIVTLDESWFSLSTDHEFVWLPQGEQVPERELHTIQSKKFMLTIVWNPRRFHLIHVLAQGHKFNDTFSVTEI